MLDIHTMQRSNLPKANVSLNKYESDIWKFFRSKAFIVPIGLLLKEFEAFTNWKIPSIYAQHKLEYRVRKSFLDKINSKYHCCVL